jgi:hypothetical protein
MQTSRQLIFETTLRLHLAEAMTLPLPALFVFDARDPFAITAKITDGVGRPIVWRLGRELLWTGLSRQAGEGDVRIEPVEAGQRILIRLRNGDAEAVLEAAAEPIRRWVKTSLVAVPWGAEGACLDWDAELSALLRGAQPSTEE